MTALIRSDSLRGYVELVRELGGEPCALLRAVQIDEAMLAAEEGFIPFRSLLLVLENTAAALACTDFGLRLSVRQDATILGPIAIAAQHSPTLGHGLLAISRYMQVYSPAMGFRVQPLEGERMLLSFSTLLPHPPFHPQGVELAVGVMYGVVEWLSGGACRPQEVRFPHARLSSPAVYRRYFRCGVRFGEKHAGLVMNLADFSLPVHGESNPQLQRLALRYLDSQLGQAPAPEAPVTLAVRVRRQLKTLLESGQCTQGEVAETLRLHPRTLQRRLREEGTSFDELRDEVRRYLAERYLTQPEISLGHIAALLGFSEQSAFTRACRRWFGLGPRDWRRREVGEEG